MPTKRRSREVFDRIYVMGMARKMQAEARCNELIGLWAADLMGRSDRFSYAITLNDIAIAAAGRNDMFFKLREDFEEAGIAITDRELHEAAERLFEEAVEEILRKQS